MYALNMFFDISTIMKSSVTNVTLLFLDSIMYPVFMFLQIVFGSELFIT